MLVRGVPVTPPDAVAACDGPNFSMRQTWPTRSEDDAAGLTPVDDRMERHVAFSLLSDFRLAPAFAGVDFKNEEVVNTGAFRADQRNHQDEDFLMDPNAAAALTALVALVEREWRDPFTGEAAVRVRVTEAYDSLIEHSSTSTHYQGRALDLTTSPVPAADGPTRRHWYGRLSRLAVCAGFDWVFFENAAHVHASVVPTEVALVAEADGELRIETGSLLAPRRLRPTGRRLTSISGTPDTLRWDASGAFELLSSAAQLVEGSGRARTSEVAFTTVDGLRQIVIRDGRAYLVNTSPVPPLGSIDAEGRPVDVEYPVALSPPGAFIRAASFREHAPTRNALDRLASEPSPEDTSRLVDGAIH
jgi:hypothetical protein